MYVLDVIVDWLQTFYLANAPLIDHINRLGQLGLLISMAVSTIWLGAGWIKRKWASFASRFSDVAALSRASTFSKTQQTIALWKRDPLIMHTVVGTAVIYSLLDIAAMIAVGLTLPDGLWKVILIWYFFLCACYNGLKCIPVFDLIMNPQKRCDRLIKLLDRHIVRSEGKRPERTLNAMKGVREAIVAYKLIGQDYLQPGSIAPEQIEEAKQNAAKHKSESEASHLSPNTAD